MIKVSSSQFNYQYGGEIRFPYSIGCLVSYIQSKPDLTKNFKFEKSFVFRDKIDDYIKQCKDSDIFLGSCYAWNWEFTKLLVKEIKKINPESKINFSFEKKLLGTAGAIKKVEKNLLKYIL